MNKAAVPLARNAGGSWWPCGTCQPATWHVGEASAAFQACSMGVRLAPDTAEILPAGAFPCSAGVFQHTAPPHRLLRNRFLHHAQSCHETRRSGDEKTFGGCWPHGRMLHESNCHAQSVLPWHHVHLPMARPRNTLCWVLYKPGPEAVSSGSFQSWSDSAGLSLREHLCRVAVISWCPSISVVSSQAHFTSSV